MRSYSTTRFTQCEQELLVQAQTLVEAVPSTVGEQVRCHELARAVATILSLPVQDGRFEAVEHSWIWAKSGWEYHSDYRDFCGAPPILDVYVPGCLPQVQLVDWSHWGLPYKRVYVPGELRNDIDDEMLKRLVAMMGDTK